MAAESISDANLADYIAAETQLYGVSPSRLMFEITETAAISNIKQASAFATNVRERGCGLALDDFGAGFASFLYLKQLPFDYLKIDGSFIQELSADYPNQVMVQSMVQAARGLGKRTIAEWVDDEDTLTQLTAYGVDFAQGYHIARPVPATELIDAPRASA